MFKNDFQELQRQIKPSDALIEQTKAKMQQALQEKLLNEKNHNKKNLNEKIFVAKKSKKTMQIVYRTTATAACVMFVAVTGFYFNEVNKNSEQMSHGTALYNSAAKDSVTSEIILSEATTPSNEDQMKAIAPESDQTPSSTQVSKPNTEEETTVSTNEESTVSVREELTSSAKEEAKDDPKAPADDSSKPATVEKPNTEIQKAPPSKPNTVLTKLEPGVHTNSVRLNNGSLNFVSPEYPKMRPPSFTFIQMELVDWTLDQYFKYLGRDPRPTVIPSDLNLVNLKPDSKLKVSVKKDGSLSNSNITFTYCNTEEQKTTVQRQLKVTTAKGTYPKLDLIFFFDKENASEINEVPVNVGYQLKSVENAKNEQSKTYPVYCAQFVYNDIGYYIESQSLTQEEFISVLLSIIK